MRLRPPNLAETKFRFGGADLEFKAAGTLETLTPHANASAVREANDPSGADFQSMHLFPQKAGIGIEGYDPKAALTRVAQRDIHLSIDKGWLRDTRALAAAGETEMPAWNMYETVSSSIEECSMLTQMEKNSLKARLFDEMFVELRLSFDSPVRVPFSKKQ
jgi:hypothetical protein